MLPILRALNNFTMSKPAKRRKKTPAEKFKLVKKRTQFDSSEEVMRFLPDILCGALARSWIDREFQTDFMLDPEGVLARYAVFLPPNVTIENDTLAHQPSAALDDTDAPIAPPSHFRKRWASSNSARNMHSDTSEEDARAQPGLKLLSRKANMS